MSNTVRTVKKKILDALQAFKRNIGILIKLLPVLSFIIPFIVLYYLYPNSFEETWKGRTYYLFFIWLALLETILSWEELETNKINKLRSKRTIGLIVFLLLPTFYVLITNFLGLNSAIVQWYMQFMGSEYDYSWWAQHMPLSIEYFAYGTIFLITNIIIRGKKRLTTFSISTSLLFAIGTFYIVDNFFPYGRIMLLQLPALPTAHLAANILNLMGYQTGISISITSYQGWMPVLTIRDPHSLGRFVTFGIGWVCSGVESLIIYTITIMLFLKKSAIQWKHRIIYFMIGAVITFFVNVLRIVSIFDIAMKYGWRPDYTPPEVARFHDYYGPLYSIIWIISYPLIIIGGTALWRKIKNRRTTRARSKVAPFSVLPAHS
jgi:exosortase/archaeosortase family protein